MKKLIYLFLIVHCSLYIDNCMCQIQFQCAIGGTSIDRAYSIIQTTDGGYAVAGMTYSFGAVGYDMYIVKLNSSGTLQWSKVIGSISMEEAYSIIQTTDGGFAVAGSSQTGAGSVMYIIKLDSIGTIQWVKAINGTSYTVYNFANSIIQTIDDGYVIAGHTNSFGAGNFDILIIKLNSSGNLQWSRTIGGTNDDIANSIKQTRDGGFVVAGSTGSFGAGDNDMFILKLNSSGNLQWSRTMGGASNDFARSIIQSRDGGYAIAGYTRSFGAGNSDMYIVKFNSRGTLQWSRTVGSDTTDCAYSIIQTTDGGYAATGYTGSYGTGCSYIYFVKLNSSGTLQWSRIVGGDTTNNAYSIIQTTDGGYAIAGFTNSFGAGSNDMYIVKFDANWNTCGNTYSFASSSGTGGITTSPTPIVSSPTLTIDSPSLMIGSGGTITNICTLVGIKKPDGELPQEYILEQNFPNPFNPTTNIKYQIARHGGSSTSFVTLKVYEILGREIATLVNEKMNAGKFEVEWNASNYPSGIYFYRLIAGDYSETKRMILLK